MTPASDGCRGGETAVRPGRPARVCTYCREFDPRATTQLPGFAGATCASFQRRADDAALRDHRDDPHNT